MPNAYDLARDRYAQLGVDTDAAVNRLLGVPISLQCWQADDVRGFEATAQDLGSGLAVTGNYPGRARTPDELRGDAEKAMSLIPGTQRLNLHAMYVDTDEQPDRDAIEVKHFQPWIDWAKGLSIGLDFNPSFFSHPKADDGFTLASADDGIRAFWIEHGKRCRTIGAAMGKACGSPTVTNIWIPDGFKDEPADRLGPRQRLKSALNEVLAEKIAPAQHLDAVESKLFGIGSESYVVGSHEFYMGYAMQNGTVLCLDAGHFHPTESVGEKISSVMQFVDRLLLHVSRGVRWDSDHVVLFDDPTRSIARELVRGDFLDRTHVGLDFFDASINRVAAWVIGTRAISKALLAAMLEPTEKMQSADAAGDFTTRLALLEESRCLPFGAVWDEACRRSEVPEEGAWLAEVKSYESDVLSKRG